MEKVERDSYLNGAMESGVANEAVISSIDSVIRKSEEVGFVPRQFGKMIKTIMDTKISVPQKINDGMASSLVKKGFGRLIAALEYGITKEEINAIISKGFVSGNEQDVNFITNLVAHLKKKENILTMSEQSEKAPYQKVYTN